MSSTVLEVKVKESMRKLRSEIRALQSPSIKLLANRKLTELENILEL